MHCSAKLCIISTVAIWIPRSFPVSKVSLQLFAKSYQLPPVRHPDYCHPPTPLGRMKNLCATFVKYRNDLYMGMNEVTQSIEIWTQALLQPTGVEGVAIFYTTEVLTACHPYFLWPYFSSMPRGHSHRLLLIFLPLSSHKINQFCSSASLPASSNHLIHFFQSIYGDRMGSSCTVKFP